MRLDALSRELGNQKYLTTNSVDADRTIWFCRPIHPFGVRKINVRAPNPENRMEAFITASTDVFSPVNDGQPIDSTDASSAFRPARIPETLNALWVA